MRLTYVLIIVLFAGKSIAQTGTYTRDIETVRQTLSQTHSFRSQITGSKKTEYEQLYQRLKADSLHSIDDPAYFHNLSRLFFPIKDNHLSFYQLPDQTHFADEQSVQRYINSPAFHLYPSVQLNIDSLKLSLEMRSPDSIEGIYYYDSFFKVGLYRTSAKELKGVIVESAYPLWARGQVAITLYEKDPGLYKAIYSHPVTKNLMLVSNEKFRDGALLNSHFYFSVSDKPYSKINREIDHVNLPKQAGKFQFKSVAPGVQYMLVRTFQSNSATRAESEQFINAIKDSLTAPKLILDLRNNEGGAESAAKAYLQLMREYTKRGKLYVLMNNGTLSQAELLIMKLKKLPNVLTVGQPSKGMLTYGSNYGKRVKLPSGRFEVYPTDMKGSKEELQYEDVGIMPDILLSSDVDWIMQVVKTMLKS